MIPAGRTPNVRSMKLMRRLAPLAGLALGYARVRPWIIHWGATDEEVSGEFPGADLFPGAQRTATMATTIEAPPAVVWSWLIQMGADRAGWYSWDRLDNFGRPSAARIHPRWQAIALGDRFRGTRDGSQSWQVAVLDPGRFLGLRMSLDLRGRQLDPAAAEWPRSYTDSLWGFLLEELPGPRTRLVVSGYWVLRPRWLQRPASLLLLEPSHWIMQTRQFHNLKRRIEGTGLGPERPTPVRSNPVRSPTARP